MQGYTVSYSEIKLAELVLHCRFKRSYVNIYFFMSGYQMTFKAILEPLFDNLFQTQQCARS